MEEEVIKKLKISPVFLKRMQQLLGGDYQKFLKSLLLPEQKAIFVNKNKIDLNFFKQIANFDVEQIGYEPYGFFVQEKLGKHPLHQAGAFYVQDASAMFTVNSINFSGEELVLDMCASPGGKTVQIANRLTTGALVSNEIVPSRAKVLLSNVERMGLKNVIVSNDTPQNLATAYANTFDVVFVDAPCSGEGMFRRGEEYTAAWNENLQTMCAARQLEILECANKCLKQNGKLVYSTCTYNKTENEDVVNQFLKLHKYSLINIDAPKNFARGVDMPQAVRIYPFNNKGEGQFVAVLVKQEAENAHPALNLKLKENVTGQEFLKNQTNLLIGAKNCKNLNKNGKICKNLKNFDLNFGVDGNNLGFKTYEFNSNIYYVANLQLIKRNVHYCSLGVNLGQEVNKIFKPSQFLFSAFGKAFKNVLNFNFDNENVLKFLHGECLNTDISDGYGAVLVNNCPLGGFKISGGKFKNLYPKGLRV